MDNENQKPYIDYVIDYAKAGAKWILIVSAIVIVADIFGDHYNLKWQSPLIIEARKENIVVSPVSAESEEKQEESPQVEEDGKSPVSDAGDYTMWAGNATWYGARPEWCVGCDSNFIMANGKRLDDSKKTIAFNKVPLGTWVTVTNVNNGNKEEVEVTDTGGFESLGRIADMSVALKNALGCGDVCTVTIETY